MGNCIKGAGCGVGSNPRFLKYTISAVFSAHLRQECMAVVDLLQLCCIILTLWGLGVTVITTVLPSSCLHGDFVGALSVSHSLELDLWGPAQLAHLAGRWAKGDLELQLGQAWDLVS